MPSSVPTVLLAFGAVLLAVSPIAGAVVAGVGALLEIAVVIFASIVQEPEV